MHTLSWPVNGCVSKHLARLIVLPNLSDTQTFGYRTQLDLESLLTCCPAWVAQAMCTACFQTWLDILVHAGALHTGAVPRLQIPGRNVNEEGAAEVAGPKSRGRQAFCEPRYWTQWSWWCHSNDRICGASSCGLDSIRSAGMQVLLKDFSAAKAIVRIISTRLSGSSNLLQCRSQSTLSASPAPVLLRRVWTQHWTWITLYGQPRSAAYAGQSMSALWIMCTLFKGLLQSNRKWHSICCVHASRASQPADGREWGHCRWVTLYDALLVEVTDIRPCVIESCIIVWVWFVTSSWI